MKRTEWPQEIPVNLNAMLNDCCRVSTKLLRRGVPLYELIELWQTAYDHGFHDAQILLKKHYKKGTVNIGR